tara:strand:+ start:992 stop:2203 length:1212 start_codon:yes stop_codon:yes gene_type:complete
MKEIEKIAEDLFDKIRTRFSDLSLGTDDAKATDDPSKARFFNFDFTIGSENYGNITISIADDASLKLYFSKDTSEKIPEQDRKVWYKFLKDIRFFAKRNMMTFDARDLSRNNLSNRDIKTVSKADGAWTTDNVSVKESKLYGTSRSSYEKMGPVKIVIRHQGKVDENVRGSRTRQIAAIYVENAEGERLKLPFNNISAARAMARHLQNGGVMGDTIGEHITALVTEMSDLRLFVRKMRGTTFDDSETNKMVESAIDYYGDLHERLHKLKGNRGYKKYVTEYKPTEVDSSDFDEEALRERFTRKLFDDRMSSALSSVFKAHKMRQQAVPETALGLEFEAWADDLLEYTPEVEETVDRYDAQADFIDDIEHDAADNEKDDPYSDDDSTEEESLELQFIKKLSGIK